VSKPEVTHKKYLLQEVIDRCSELNIPAQVVLELTYRCNLHCVHCYIDVEEPDELSVDEWKDVIDQLKAAGTIYLLFTGGEIMVRDDFMEIATYARRNGFLVGFLTNATLLTPDVVKDIVDLKPFAVTTSLYGTSPQVHEEVTGVAGSFEKTIAGIKMLVDSGIKPLVQTLVMKHNVHELMQIRELVRILGADSHISVGIQPSKTGADYPFQYDSGEVELRDTEKELECPYPNRNTGVDMCKAGKALCSISPRGDVYPCLMFPMKLGSLKKSSFDSIWKLEPCVELRYLRSMRRTDLYACKECELATYCQRCTGVAYLESGMFNGPSDSACRRAQTRWLLNQAAEVKS
jgi:radical SAM protein with 4Fe4S-binding SPASM domain